MQFSELNASDGISKIMAAALFVLDALVYLAKTFSH